MTERLRALLESQRGEERRLFADLDAAVPEGAWRPAQHIAHFDLWRGRFAAAANRFLERGERPAPDDVDALNAQVVVEPVPSALEAEWEAGWEGVLAVLDRCRADQLELDMGWHGAPTIRNAIFRNSYVHPRDHLAEHAYERGDTEWAIELGQGLVNALDELGGWPRAAGLARIQQAVVLALRGDVPASRRALAKALELLPDLAGVAARDPRLAAAR